MRTIKSTMEIIIGLVTGSAIFMIVFGLTSYLRNYPVFKGLNEIFKFSLRKVGVSLGLLNRYFDWFGYDKFAMRLLIPGAVLTLFSIVIIYFFTEE